MSNLPAVQEIYAAFGRGDVPAILSRLSESVEWEYGATPSDIPYIQTRHGREGAAAFFAGLSATTLHTFTPKELLEGDGVVVVLIDVELTVNATGKRVVEEDEVHIWRFDSEGKVTRFRHRADTHAHHLACRK